MAKANDSSQICAQMTKPLYEVREIKDLRDLISQSVSLYGDRYAFEVKSKNEHRLITYREYAADIRALGTAILAHGLAGKHIAVAADNSYDWCNSYLATVNSGCVIVPIDKELFFDDIIGIIEAAKIELLFCDRKFLQKLERDRLPAGLSIVCFDPEEGDGVIDFEEFKNEGRSLLSKGDTAFDEVKIDPEKMCTIIFTSGTTGAAKGVMLSQRNFCREVMVTMGVVKVIPEDCGISMLPLHHTYESTIILFCAPYGGVKVTFCEGFKYVLRNMKEFAPSVFVSVPLVLETVHRRIIKAIKAKPHGEEKFKIGKKLCKAASKVGIDLKKVFFKEIQDTFGGNMRLIICGSAPIRPEILEDFDAFGIQILFGYGLTECAPLAIINNDKLRLAESVGVPLPDVQAKIIDPDPQTGVGEICIKGPMVMMGYYENPRATAEVIDEDGFLHTGDLGRMDEKGRFYISGRIKNVIVTENGKNIYPEELEYHLSLSPLVEEALVYGETDAKGDTIVKATIVPNEEEIKAQLGTDTIDDETREKVIAQVVRQVNSKLPQFKHIREHSLRSTAFVKNTTQKILRYKSENKN